jgi:poly-gamma-glutamate synthesis protein (capsule biosynthesis protein)
VAVRAVGDLILGSAVKEEIAAHGADYPFARIASSLRRADLTVGNLEGPLTNAAIPTSGKRPQDVRAGLQFIFRAPPACADGLARAGFDIVTVANNHAADYREAGLDDTLQALAARGIAAVGAGRDLSAARAPAVLYRRGRRVAFLAYSDVIPPLAAATAERAGISPSRQPGVPFERLAARDIARARRRADFVIVLVHWGVERSGRPTPEQRRIGRAMVDAGACAVIGHHPHVLQGIERRGNGIIAYSLGNFVHVAGAATMDSAVLTLTLAPGRPPGCDVTPVVIRQGQPQPARGEAARRILEHLAALSRALGTGMTVGPGGARVAGKA